MKQKHIIIVLAGLIIFSATACRHERDDVSANPGGGGTGGGGTGGGGGGGSTGPVCNPDTVYFQQQVLPILISNCTMSGCHDEASHQDGVVLTNYNSIINTGDVEPGNPNNSELYEVLVDSDPSDRMPRNAPPLPAAQIALIRKWIEQGAKNNSCVELACDSSNVSYSATLTSIINSKCAGCHGGSAPQAGINLTNYAGLKAKINDGRLWGAINHLPGYSPMPKNGQKLSACEIAKFKNWIAAGAPNN